MSFLGDLEGILDPGGDPQAVHLAATATRTLASDLRENASALDSVAAGLEKAWKGAGSGEEQSAAAAFQRAWSKFSQEIVECARQLDVAATRIDDIADAIQTAQAEAAKLRDTIEITLAGGALLTIFSFGVSDATAEAMASAEIAVAAGVMTEFEAFLASSVALLSDVATAVGGVAAQFALGAAFDGLSIMATKPFEGENPFSLSSYDANDFTNVILGGLVSGALGAAVNGVEPISDFMSAHPIAGSALWNATAALTWGVPWQFGILGKPFDLKTWEMLGESTGISLVSASALGKAGAMGGPLGKILNAEGDLGIAGVTKADVVNNGVTLPIGMLKYALFGGPQPAGLPAPDGEPALPGAPVPHAVTPQAPGLPPDSTTRVVQPGESVWEIAGGDTDLAQRIAEVNHLEDASLIEPGQVLIIPPGG